MINELEEKFILSNKAINRRIAFTMWLQNVLEMPIHLNDENIQKFLAENKMSEKELIETVNELDINPMIIDDILKFSSAGRSVTDEAA